MINYKLQIKYKKGHKGAATLVLVFFFMFISITILIGIVTPVVREFKIASNVITSRQSYFASESGVEDAIYRIKNNKQIGSSETIVLGSSTATTTINSITANKKEISSLGDSGSLQRKNNISLTTSPGLSFSYGAQVGGGGLFLGNGVQVESGDIYVSGNLTAQSVSVHGNIYAASPVPAPAHVSNIGASTPPSSVILGYSPKEDFAQSFTTTASGVLKRVSLYMKTNQSAGNFTVSVVNDNYGSPGTTTLATWTTPQNSFGTMSSFGWVNADFTTTPTLSANTKYWIIFNHTTSQWNHHTLGLTTGGEGKVRSNNGSAWVANSPASTSYYKVFFDRVPSYIQGESYGSINLEGNAYAETVGGVNVNSNYNLYCQAGRNNKNCVTAPEESSNPQPLSFPVTNEFIDSWKEQATAGGVTNGSVSINWSGGSLGPRKIVGDLIITSGKLTINGPVYVTGKIQVSNGGDIELASSFGTNDGIIISDGPIYIYGGASVRGSGNSNSFLVLVTTNNAIHSGSISNKEQFAGYLDNGGDVDAFYAPNGEIWVAGGSELNTVVAYQMAITNGAKINFKSALSSLGFQSSNASGSWNLASWKEAQ